MRFSTCSRLVLLGALFAVAVTSHEIDEDAHFFDRPAAPVPEKRRQRPSLTRSVKHALDYRRHYHTYMRDPVGYVKSFVIEIFALSFVLPYVVFEMMKGKRANRDVVVSWVNTTKSLFHKHFAQVGINNTYAQGYSWGDFEFYATGRSVAHYFSAKIRCLPRHCPWQRLFRHLKNDCEDRIALEIPFQQSAQEMFSLVVGRRREMKTLESLNDDVGQTVSLRKTDGLLPYSLCCLSDCQEAVDRVFTDEVCGLLASAEDLVRHIFVSDILPATRHEEMKPTMHAVIALPPLEKMERVLPLIEALLCIVDNCAALVLTDKPGGRPEVKKSRSVVEKRQLQAEEAERQQKISDKRSRQKKDEEEKLKRMTPDQQRKVDEKQAKKDARNRGPRLKLLK